MRTCDRCDEEKRPKDFLGDSERCKECSMFRITAEGVRDYQVCSLYHKYRHVDGVKVSINNRRLMLNRFQSTLRKVINFYFYKKQAGTPPSYNALLNRWERLWFPKDMDDYDLKASQHTVSHGNLTQYSTRAATSLRRLYDDFESIKIEPLIISEPFSVPLTREVVLDGVFDLVYREAGEYTVVTWGLAPRHLKPQSIPIELSTVKMAYERRKPDGVNVNYILYNMTSNKSGATQIPHDVFQEGMVSYWAVQAYEGQHVPRRGYTAYCKGCPFDEECKTFWGAK